ncbi:MAG TPA: HlyD family secretion protein, partial [Candidatus Acidoferrales bacterium]|nr:HlyD family secretion protein [Candidatus Acidoferrales bacterium]
MNPRTTEAEPHVEQQSPGESSGQGEGQRTAQDAPPRRPSPLKNPRVRRGLLIFAIIVVVAGFFFWFHYRNHQSTDDAQVDGHLIPISSRVPGSVLEVLVHDNESVKKGQVLVKLDPRDYQAKLDNAQAKLAVAQSKVLSANVNVPLTSATTRSDVSSGSATVAAAESAYQQAQLGLQEASTSGLAYAKANVQKEEAAYQKAQSDLARVKPLVAKNEISQQQYDAYSAAATEAEGELSAARQSLALAQQTVSVRQAQVSAAKADLERAHAGLQAAQANTRQVRVSVANAASARAAVQEAQAEVETAQLNLEYTTITAPDDGVVTNKTVQVGQIVSPGQALMIVVPLRETWVTANFKETQLAHVRPGDRAEVHVDMYGKTFPGHVDSIAGATGSRLSLLPPENATGNYVKVVER